MPPNLIAPAPNAAGFTRSAKESVSFVFEVRGSPPDLTRIAIVRGIQIHSQVLIDTISELLVNVTIELHLIDRIDHVAGELVRDCQPEVVVLRPAVKSVFTPGRDVDLAIRRDGLQIEELISGQLGRILVLNHLHRIGVLVRT